MNADISVLGYALLGLLARAPATGYDVSLKMRSPVGFFWHARHSQIYPELARLEQGGFVTHEVVIQSDRPNKKVFALTDAGRLRLQEWVTSPLGESGPRDELVLRVFSLWTVDPAAAAQLLRTQQERHLTQLREYERFEGEILAVGTPAVSSPEFAVYATLRRGLSYEREYADWCGWVAGCLEAGGTMEARPASAEGV